MHNFAALRARRAWRSILLALMLSALASKAFADLCRTAMSISLTPFQDALSQHAIEAIVKASGPAKPVAIREATHREAQFVAFTAWRAGERAINHIQIIDWKDTASRPVIGDPYEWWQEFTESLAGGTFISLNADHMPLPLQAVLIRELRDKQKPPIYHLILTISPEYESRLSLGYFRADLYRLVIPDALMILRIDEQSTDYSAYASFLENVKLQTVVTFAPQPMVARPRATAPILTQPRVTETRPRTETALARWIKGDTSALYDLRLLELAAITQALMKVPYNTAGPKKGFPNLQSAADLVGLTEPALLAIMNHGQHSTYLKSFRERLVKSREKEAELTAEDNALLSISLTQLNRDALWAEAARNVILNEPRKFIFNSRTSRDYRNINSLRIDFISSLLGISNKTLTVERLYQRCGLNIDELVRQRKPEISTP